MNDIREKEYFTKLQANIEGKPKDPSAAQPNEKNGEALLETMKIGDVNEMANIDGFPTRVGRVIEYTREVPIIKNEVGCYDEQEEYITSFMNCDSGIKKEEIDDHEDVKIDIEGNSLNHKLLEDVKHTIAADISSTELSCVNEKYVAHLEGSCNEVRCKDDHRVVIKDDIDIKEETANLEDVATNIDGYTNDKILESKDLKSTEVICEENGDLSQSVEVFQCKSCEYKAKTKHAFQKHFEVKHNRNSETEKEHILNSHEQNAERYQCQLCEFKTKCKSTLNRHFKNEHSEVVEWYQCQHCTFKTKNKHCLKGHFKHKHDDSAEWYHCEFCKYKTKRKSNLTIHFKYKHDQDVEWHQCQKCMYKTKCKYSLRKHFKRMHDDTAELYYCKLCEYRNKIKDNVKSHFKQVHSKDIKWHRCQSCMFAAKSKRSLKKHFKYKHDDTVEWHHCKHCKYRTKVKGNLKKHSVKVHSQDSQWH